MENWSLIEKGWIPTDCQLNIQPGNHFKDFKTKLIHPSFITATT